MSYKIFTIESGAVEEGATVESFTFRNGEITIPAITVGEEGRGRTLGVLPVAGANAGDVIHAADVGETRSGKAKLVARDKASHSDKAIVIFRTEIGYRGGNSHTGDRQEMYFTLDYSGNRGIDALGLERKARYTEGEARDLSPKMMRAAYPDEDEKHWREFAGFDRHIDFEPFPGETITSGRIAQGAAGGMGSGEQIVALVPRDVVFRTGYSGRLYGAPSAHYYMFDGEKITPLTWDERELADLW